MQALAVFLLLQVLQYLGRWKKNRAGGEQKGRMFSKLLNVQNRQICRVGGREGIARVGGGRMGSGCSWRWVSFWSDEHVLELLVMLPNSVSTLKVAHCTL